MSMSATDRLEASDEGAAAWTEEDDQELDYDQWHAFVAKDALLEEHKIRPPREVAEIWPDWRHGRPTTFRRNTWSSSFFLKGVYHRDKDYSISLALDWNAPYLLPRLKDKPSLLPSNYTSEWSGVYRVFSRGTPIARCCGTDPTGTLYLGRAGSRGGNWSILRTRIAAIVKRDHHATNSWMYSEVSRKRFPWETLAVEWAYTGSRLDHKGESVPAAILAERWLLASYNDSYGEFPPWNQRGG